MYKLRDVDYIHSIDLIIDCNQEVNGEGGFKDDISDSD